MAKKSCWFDWVRRLFLSPEKPKEKKSKKWKWVLGRLKFKRHPALSAPPSTINEATEMQRKHALTVALATAAAAEAAVAAAQAAAEVVRLTSASQSYHHETKRDQHLAAIRDQHLAAIKIQSAFRAYLARKALRALKGVVRLQALVRGQAVRRQAAIKLKHLPSNSKTQSEHQAKNAASVDGSQKHGENKQFVKSKELIEKESKLEHNRQRSWDLSMLSKEDVEALWLKRKEATVKRERMMKYSFSQREGGDNHMLEELLPNGESRMEQWTDKAVHNREGMENSKVTATANVLANDTFVAAPVRTRSIRKQDSVEVSFSPMSFARRSFCRTQRNAAGDDIFVPNSPVIPTYMAATESAKAKARSMSTPRQRVGFHDTHYDHSLPCRNGASFWSTHNGELFRCNGKTGGSQHMPLTSAVRFRQDTEVSQRRVVESLQETQKLYKLH